MFKRNLLVASVALMAAGLAQAEAPRDQEREARATVAKNDAVRPMTRTQASERAAVKEQPTEALHPDARPVYLNGGHFGD